MTLQTCRTRSWLGLFACFKKKQQTKVFKFLNIFLANIQLTTLETIPKLCAQTWARRTRARQTHARHTLIRIRACHPERHAVYFWFCFHQINNQLNLKLKKDLKLNSIRQRRLHNIAWASSRICSCRNYSDIDIDWRMLSMLDLAM